ncbi:MAG: hypothetical protein ACLSVD_11505 [Eggerthellaceae bacterium]
MAELEYACFDCRAVALARLIVLGCSDVVTVTAIALAAPVMLAPIPRVARARVRSLLPLVRGRAARGAPVPSSQALALSCAWALLVIAERMRRSPRPRCVPRRRHGHGRLWRRARSAGPRTRCARGFAASRAASTCSPRVGCPMSPAMPANPGIRRL